MVFTCMGACPRLLKSNAVGPRLWRCQRRNWNRPRNASPEFFNLIQADLFNSYGVTISGGTSNSITSSSYGTVAGGSGNSMLYGFAATISGGVGNRMDRYNSISV